MTILREEIEMTYADCTTKKAKIEYVRKACHVSYKWASEGLLRIYDYQTADEQASGTTRVNNNVGFSGCDAEILSSFAEQVRKGRTLSARQREILFKKMPRYAKQLVAIAEAKKAEEAAA